MESQGNQPFVSIVILNHNGQELLEQCMNSVTKTRYPNFEIVLVDNASTDASIVEMEKRRATYRNIRIVRNDYNVGFAEGNNIGGRHAKGDLLVFINNDTEVPPDWLDDLVKTAMDDPFAAIVLPRVICPASPDGLLVGNVDRLGNAVLIDIPPPRQFLNIPSPRASKVYGRLSDFETIAAGPAFLIKRKVWEELGGFDTKYFIYAEDIDLSWRARLVGYRTTVSKSSFVRHKVAGTMRKSGLNERRYLTYRNTLRTLIKDYSTATLPRVLPPFFVIRIGEALALSFLVRSPKIVSSLVRAIGWNIRHFTDSWSLHVSIQTRRTISDSEVQRVMARLSIGGLSSVPVAIMVPSKSRFNGKY